MATAPTEKLDPSRLAAVSVFLLERNNEVATGLRTMLRGVGMAGVKTFGNADELEANLASSPPDVLILSESEDVDIFEITKKIRYSAVERNPFTVILLLMLPNKPESITAALKSGADSALVKPVASTQLVEQVAQLAFSRPAFIATTDYIGPERRSTARPSDIPLIQTINTLRYKLERKTIAPEALNKAIASVTSQVWLSQLISHGLKLKRSCDMLLAHQGEQRPPEAMKASLLELVGALEEAAAISQQLNQVEFLKTCQELAKEIKMLADDPSGIDEKKIRKLALIPEAFEIARKRMTPRT